ncbi:DNA repair protein RecN [Alicyclobacillus tolerans]|uniref:DNA repair protein RecN n=1 Tax=Alicyclobacillus tolerans TaxID=90970 RepID=UPI001F0317E7|nr:DNA repair protein RecN [Alicyclobacillus tolerans]MCF8563608.1 DNA repair protein RecN [Alicyclobacillus tolerans]
MLLELSVRNVALIESIHLQLQPGFTVLTGETGAGKSILLDSIGLLLGNRASSEWIRHGQDKAVVEASIQLDGPARHRVLGLLEAWGLDLVDGDPLVISRELHRSGRTSCRINGRMATVQMLKELGEHLVQQHGQHDQQGLLKPEEQLRLLDLYGHHAPLLEQLRQQYHAWRSAVRRWKEAHVDEQERIRRIDMLNFQIDEIESAELQPGEEESLREQRKVLQFADKIAAALEEAVSALSGDDRNKGVTDLLVTASTEVAAAADYDSTLEEAKALVESAQVYADEANRILLKHLGKLERDPHRLEAVEDRLVQIRNLERKYGPTIEDILRYLQEASEERTKLQDHEHQLEQLYDEVKTMQRQLHQTSLELHERRQEAAQKLSASVQGVLQKLDMQSARLEISVTQRAPTDSGEVSYSESGLDAVSFLFSANRGEDPKPLQRIASGGELSRTLLAVKSVLAQVDDIETLIFDEIDTGVSGFAAQRIAEQLRHLAGSRQVLCVTHSPQIAAAAQSQYRIQKREEQSATVTEVQAVESEQRVGEIARLLGAGLSDETAIEHAKALLDSFRQDNLLT